MDYAVADTMPEPREERRMARHPGSIDQHAGKWRIRLCVAGKRHFYWLELDTPQEDVEQHARAKHVELKKEANRRADGLPDRVRFSELLKTYRSERLGLRAPNSQKAYETTLQAAETFFVTQGGDPAAHKVRRDHVSRFLSWRRWHAPDGTRHEDPVQARTVNKDRVVLGVLFEFGVERGVVDQNPVRYVPEVEGDSREPVILNGDEYERLIVATEGRPMLRLHVLVMGEAGLRADSESLHLEWDDVDLESGFLTVRSGRDGHRTKSGKSRKVPMTARLRDAMREHFAAYRFATYRGKRTSYVFHHELDRRHAKAGSRITGLRRAFNSAVDRAGLPTGREGLNQHDLRHRRVTEWLRDGHPAHKVQKAMGHADLKTTLHYEHMVEDDLLTLVAERKPALMATGTR
jgi:site-specific recombinase XerD